MSKPKPNATGYQQGMLKVLYWVDSAWREAFEEFGKRHSYDLVFAGDDLREIARRLITGEHQFQAVLAQEIRLVNELFDAPNKFDGRVLIDAIEGLFRINTSHREYVFPRILMRPLPIESGVCGSNHQLWPPIWPMIDHAIKIECERLFGRFHLARFNPYNFPVPATRFPDGLELQKLLEAVRKCEVCREVIWLINEIPFLGNRDISAKLLEHRKRLEEIRRPKASQAA